MVGLEGIALLVAAPFLLFPESYPLGTAAVLVVLATIWLSSLRLAPPPSTPLDIILLPWGVVLAIGIAVSADPLVTLPKATGLILGLAVWRYPVIAARTHKHIFLLAGVLLLICVGFSITGLAGLREIPKIGILSGVNPLAGLPMLGLDNLAVHPNELAGLIGLYLPLLIALIAAPPQGLPALPTRLVLVVLTMIVMAILLLTQSRGGWVGVLVGMFVLLASWSWVMPVSGRRKAMRRLAVACLVVAFVAVVWIGPAELQRLWLDPPIESALGSFRTLNYRKALWPWAVTAIGDFPFTGVGLGAFREVVFRLYPLPMSPSLDIGHAHSIFLQTALDVGIPGLVVYLAMLMVIAFMGLRVARHRPEFRSLSLGLLAGLAALHVFGIADALALGAKPGIIFWLALGLITAMNNLTGVQKGDS